MATEAANRTCVSRKDAKRAKENKFIILGQRPTQAISNSGFTKSEIEISVLKQFFAPLRRCVRYAFSGLNAVFSDFARGIFRNRPYKSPYS